MSPFAAVGPKLIERGFSAIPILPGSKRPGFGGRGLDDWQSRFSTRLATDIEIECWSAAGAGVGVVMGPASHDTIGIDIDVDDEAIVSAIMGALPHTPVRKAGMKGLTLFFRGPGIVSRSFNEVDADARVRRRLCDIIGAGRQTVLPPTCHPDTGEPYRWLGEDALENVEPDDLPILPPDVGEAIAAALAPFGYRPEQATRPARGDMGEDGTPHRQLNDAAMADLASWVPRLGLFRLRAARGGYEAVPTWRASSTGREIEKRKRNLKIHPTGIRDMGAGSGGLTPLDLVMLACDCDLDTAFANLAGWLGRSSGDIIDLPVRIDAHGQPAAVSVEPLKHISPPTSDADEPGLSSPPGLLGEIADWIVATARRPNRLLALGAAITVLGTLVGRRIAGPTRSGTHLYVLGLAPTGAGKDHPLTQVTRLMKAAGAGHHLGPDEFISMPAVINTLQRSPLCVCPMDEFGAFLKRINSRRASGYEQAVTKVLRSAWGKSFATLHMPEWAGRSVRPVETPAMSIFGVSTPEEFYGSLEGNDVVNGVLNRFLVLRSTGRIQDRDPEQDPADVPEWLSDALRQVYHGDNPLATARLNDQALDADPEIAGWADEGARGVYESMIGEVERSVDRIPAVAPFLARTAEMAVRLATIVAIGHGPRSRTVSADDMAWGRDIALVSARGMAGDAADFMAENDRQAQANRIIRMIRARGELRIRDIQHTMRGALKTSEIRDIVAGLVEGGHVVKMDATDPSRHTSKVEVYRVVGRDS